MRTSNDATHDDASALNLQQDQKGTINGVVEEDDKAYPKGLRLTLIFVSLVLTTFLVAIDATIIATAIPTITTQFNSLADYSWYNSAFLLTTCAFQLPYGRAYTLLDTKYTFLSSILIFEVGSVICGAAPNSIALIIGRAISGIGGSGIFGGALIIIAESTPLAKRALFTGQCASTFSFERKNIRLTV